MVRRRVAVLVVCVALIVAACGSSPTPSSGIDELPEPTSTLDLRGGGSGSLALIDLADLVFISTAAVEATVVDVRRSRANTPDGTFPKIDTSRGHEQLIDLYALTDIEIRVEAVLGDRGELEGVLVAGETVTITIFGGMLRTVLQPDEARALGVKVELGEQPVDPDAESGVDPDQTSRTPNPEEPVEVFPTEPVPFESGFSPVESLTEGDRVILFLSSDQQVGFGGGPPIEIITISHPVGVFRQNGEGAWVSDLAAPGDPGDALELAGRVGGE